MNTKPEYIPKGIFPHGGTFRRLNFEIDDLVKAGYKVNLDEIHSKKLYVEEPDNGVTHTIEISDLYPFVNVVLNNIQQTNNPSQKIIKLFELIDWKENNILVYSHPKKITIPKDHFMYEIFEQVVNQNNITDYKLYTLDISGTPDILFDGFGTQFISRYSVNPTFNIVFMPDCAGPWFELQNNFVVYEPIFELIDNVLKIVKSGGKLVISKFVMDGLFEAVLAHYPNSTVLKFNDFNDKILEITRNY